jgi:hypothetical protein
MVNQLLFGETVRIVKTKGNLWVKINSLHDGYEGWLTRTLIEPIGEMYTKEANEFVVTDMLGKISLNEKTMNIPRASSCRDLQMESENWTISHMILLVII